MTTRQNQTTDQRGKCGGGLVLLLFGVNEKFVVKAGERARVHTSTHVPHVHIHTRDIFPYIPL